jgi:ankyrin repeat protein
MNYDILFKYFENKNLMDVINNLEELVKDMSDIGELNEDDLQICLYVYAIDRQDLKAIDYLNGKNVVKQIDILLELYLHELLTLERLNFVIQHGKYFNISSNLIKHLIKNGKMDFLDKIFGNLKFFDNDFIKLILCYLYKNKRPITDSLLRNIISLKKYRIPSSYDPQTNNYQKNFNYLVASCEKGNTAMVSYLIENGADVNKNDIHGNTPLIVACRNRNEGIVRCLVKNGADVNKKDKQGNTPLIVSCKKKSERIVKYLVKNGADVNQNDGWGTTPLIIAFRCGSEAMVKHLIEHGADINKEGISSYADLNTPLTEACKIGNEAMIRYFIEHGADVNKKDGWGNTPIIIAYRNGNVAMMRYLIEHGAHISRKSRWNNNTPLLMI